MWKKTGSSRSRGFFALDASLAIAAAAIMSMLFVFILGAASISASAASDGYSGNLRAARFSSFALFMLEEKGGGFLSHDGYSRTWVVDPRLLGSVDAARMASDNGLSYASIRILSEDGESFSSSGGQANGSVYCVQRLALMSGKPVRLEVCSS